MKPNAHELVAAVELVERLGVDEFAALRFVPQGRGCENRDALELSYEAFQALLSELANLVVESNRLVVRAGCPMSFCSVYRSEIVPQECEAGRSSVLIDPNGDMYPCPALKQVPELSISTRSGAGIAAGWEGDAWDTVRGVTPESLTGDCSSCIRVAECVGRCAAQRYLSHGSFLVGPDPMCPLSRETTTEASAAQTT
jgi:radical SAM protein with 4Fe4S-binding SPASM domain